MGVASEVHGEEKVLRIVRVNPNDRGLGHPVDPRAGCAVGPAAHDLGRVLDELRDRMLDGLGELEEKLLHGRPTGVRYKDLIPTITSVDCDRFSVPPNATS